MLNDDYIKSFRKFILLLEENNINYWIVAGTLLGAIRERNFLQNDTDIDIAIPLSEKSKLQKALKGSAWTIFCMWRREWAIKYILGRTLAYKIDIFFIETNETNAYLYSYKQNSFYEMWNIEWRMIFPKECFENYDTWKLNNFYVRIPRQFEKILELEYGKNWRHPDDTWDNANSPVLDKNYREIAIIIPTFIRDEKMKKLVTSIYDNLDEDWYRLYIADQGRESEEKNEYYDKLKSQGHKIYKLPFNCGLSYARNYMVKRVTEPYVLLVDDDCLIIPETNIHNFINILNSDDDLGIVGGKEINSQNYHWNLELKDNKLFYIRPYLPQTFQTANGHINTPITYSYHDIVTNFALIKKEVFNDILWDEKLKLVEHTDFYLRLKRDTDWKVAFTDTVKCSHQTEPNQKEYSQFRGNQEWLKLFLKKWHIKSEKDIVRIIESNTIKSHCYNNRNIVINLVQYLIDLKLDFWLVDKSCLEWINHKTFNNLSLSIGVKDGNTAQKISTIVRNKSPQIRLTISIDSNKRLKKYEFGQSFVQVPLPVVEYLQNLFGENWRNL